MPADLIIYAFIAVVLVVWLKNTLGTHSEGDEPIIKAARAPLPDLNEVKTTIAAADLVEEVEPIDQIKAIAGDKSGILGVDGKTAEAGLLDVIAADPAFDLKFFFSAVQDVFVAGVESFADGDKDYLSGILGGDVYDAFEAAINQREEQGLRAQSEVTAIQEAHIIDAELNDKDAIITLRFVADQSYAVYDSDDKLVEGNPEKAHVMRDIWVFSRNLKSKDPRWLVVETRGDFEGDNDIIPNA